MKLANIWTKYSAYYLYEEICLNMCREMKIDVKNNICEHEPEPIVTNRNTTILYDKIIVVGRFIEGNTVQ